MTSTATTTSPSTTSPSTTSSPALTTRRLIGHGLLATGGAAVATSAVAAAGNAAGVSLEVAGAPIPVAGFATLTVIFSLVGLVLAAVLGRFVRRPRVVFVRTTLVLTGLSLVPDVLADAASGTKVLLMLTHLVAAAVVIPVVARRLAV